MYALRPPHMLRDIPEGVTSGPAPPHSNWHPSRSKSCVKPMEFDLPWSVLRHFHAKIVLCSASQPRLDVLYSGPWSPIRIQNRDALTRNCTRADLTPRNRSWHRHLKLAGERARAPEGSIHVDRIWRSLITAMLDPKPEATSAETEVETYPLGGVPLSRTCASRSR